MYFINSKRLDLSTGGAITNALLTSSMAVYSETIKVNRNVGFATLLITEDKAGGTGDVDISVEYSIDGTNWYVPYYTATPMDGTVTAEGNLITAIQNVTRWISFAVYAANYMRLKFDPDADSQITADILYQEEN